MDLIDNLESIVDEQDREIEGLKEELWLANSAADNFTAELKRLKYENRNLKSKLKKERSISREFSEIIRKLRQKECLLEAALETAKQE